jgi:hypothetical protein
LNRKVTSEFCHPTGIGIQKLRNTETKETESLLLATLKTVFTFQEKKIMYRFLRFLDDNHKH